MPRLNWRQVSRAFAKTECNTYQVTITRGKTKQERHTVFYNNRKPPCDWECLGSLGSAKEVVQFCQSHHDQKTATETEK